MLRPNGYSLQDEHQLYHKPRAETRYHGQTTEGLPLMQYNDMSLLFSGSTPDVLKDIRDKLSGLDPAVKVMGLVMLIPALVGIGKPLVESVKEAHRFSF